MNKSVGERAQLEESSHDESSSNYSSTIAEHVVAQIRILSRVEPLLYRRVEEILMCTNLSRIPMVIPYYDIKKIVDLLVEMQYASDFVWSPVITAEFYCELLYNGFIPLADQLRIRGPSTVTDYILLPKLHRQRCIMYPRDIHIPKKAKKRAAKFSININTSFNETLEACVMQHGENWLHPPLQLVLKRIFHNRVSYHGTKLHSIEIWSDDALVAGEIGASIGKCYASLTGFYRAQSSGTVQMCSLAVILRQQGFELWDLGMIMDYKLKLGATVVPRVEFINLFRNARENVAIAPELPEKFGLRNCGMLIKGLSVEDEPAR